MEPVSLAVSVVGLVALVGSCKELMRTAESFLQYDQEFSYYVELLRADRIYLEWVEANEEQHGSATRTELQLIRQNSLRDAANEASSERYKADNMGKFIHNNQKDNTHLSSTLKSLDENRRAQISRLLSTLEETLKSLENLLTANEPKSQPRDSSSNEWMKRPRAQMARLRKRAVYSIGGKKLTIEEQIQTSRNVISKLRLLQGVRQEHDLAAQISKLDENYGQEMKHLIQERVRAWLDPDSMTDTLEQHLSAKIKDTCQWLFDRACWEEWGCPPDDTRRDGSQILWLNGPAGCGKSVLSAAVIERLKERQKNVAFYFYSSQVQSRRYPLVAIQSMIWQIISDDSKLLKEVQDKFLNADSTASSSQIWNVFQFVTQSVDGIHYILDGLDECSRTDPSAKSGKKSLRLEFLEILMERISGTSGRVLLLSREEVDIRNGLYGSQSVHVADYSISKEDVNGDLGTVALTMVESKLGDCKTDDLKYEISTAIQERSDGMFLWMVYLEDTLNSDMSARELRSVIQAQPQELDDLFEEIWIKMVGRQNYEGFRAIQILQWLAFAVRPLTVAELVTALSISYLEEEDDAELFAMINEGFIRKRIEGPCLSLVTVKPSKGYLGPNSKVNLFHDAVRGFLIRKFDADRAFLSSYKPHFNDIAESCLEYLMKDIVWGPRGEELKVVPSLRKYATRNWPKHVQPPGYIEATTEAVLKRFFSHDNTHWAEWRDLYEKIDKSGEKPAEREYYAAQFGLHEILPFLQNEGDFEVNRRAGRYGYPLQAACFYHHADVVDLLLKNGADVNLAGGYYGSALAAAAASGSTTLVQKLLSKGAQDMLDEQGISAVFWAAKQGHLSTLRLLHNAGSKLETNVGNASPLAGASWDGHRAVVEYLIKHAIEFDIKGESGAAALGFAVAAGSLEIASMLIENGADVNRPSEYLADETPLFVACQRGDAKIVEYLVGAGADVDFRTENGWTPLSAAATYGDIEIVRSLISQGACVTTPNKLGITALHGAANQGHVAVAKLLLSKGADPNACTVKGKSDAKHDVDYVLSPRLTTGDLTPLHEAVSRGHNDMVMMLLKAGANIEAVFGQERTTPLILAMSERKAAVAITLLKFGANVHTHTKSGMTVLGVAANEGLGEVAKLCLEYHALIDEPSGSLEDTPLSLAASCSHQEIVELLVQRDANINKSSKNGETPLLIACWAGATKIVQFLVEHGAKVNVYGQEIEFTPMHHAIQRCDMNTVSLLRNHGGDIDAKSRDGWTPIHIASSQHNLDMVKYLIDEGCDIYAKSNEDLSPVQYAAEFGSAEILQELISRVGFADLTSDTTSTPLFLTVDKGDPKSTALLLERGAIINARDNKGCLPLHHTASRGLYDISKLLIENGACINARDGASWTPLHRAAFHGHLELTRLLLLHNANVNALTKDLRTAAHLVAGQGFLEILELLVKHGAWLNCNDIQQRSTLHMAAIEGHLNVVKFLISKGVAVKSRSIIGCETLHMAAYNGHFEIMDIIVENGVKIDERSDTGKTSLHWAAMTEDKDIIETLIRKYKLETDAKESLRAWTPLNYAIHESSIEAVKVLLEHEADVHNRDIGSQSPLIHAAGMGNVEILKLLLEKGAEPSAVSRSGYNAVCQAANRGKLEAIKLLIDMSAEINTQLLTEFGIVEETLRSTNLRRKTSKQHTEVANAAANDGLDGSPIDFTTARRRTGLYWRTAINCAAFSDHKDIVSHLLDCGVRATDTDLYHGTALRAALESENVEIPRLLIDAGATFHAVDLYERSALHCPIVEAHLPLLEEFLPLSKLLNQPDACGCTPAHYFARNTSPDVIKAAVKAGADFNRLDNAGWSTLHWAAYDSNSIPIIESLISLGVERHTRDWQGRMPYQVAMGTALEVAEVLCPPEFQDELKQPVQETIFVAAVCDFCDYNLHQDFQRCEICPDFDLCFRCFKDVESLHPGHSFRVKHE